MKQTNEEKNKQKLSTKGWLFLHIKKQYRSFYFFIGYYPFMFYFAK